MKLGVEIKARQGLQMDLRRVRVLTSRRARISANKSRGRVGREEGGRERVGVSLLLLGILGKVGEREKGKWASEEDKLS